MSTGCISKTPTLNIPSFRPRGSAACTAATLATSVTARWAGTAGAALRRFTGDTTGAAMTAAALPYPVAG